MSTHRITPAHIYSTPVYEELTE